MRTIGFKNFRRFEELKPIEMSGITFFVGGNNAGKSTVVKGLRLVMENFKAGLRFVQLDHPSFRLDSDSDRDVHVGTFGRALHKPYPDVKEIELESTIDNITIRYVVSGDVESQRLNADIHIYEVSCKEEGWVVKVDFVTRKVYLECPESVINNVAMNDYHMNRMLSIARTKDGLSRKMSSADVRRMLDRLTEEEQMLEERMSQADEIRQVLIQKEIDALREKKKTLQVQWDAIQAELNTDKVIQEEFALPDQNERPYSDFCEAIANMCYERAEDARSRYEQRGLASNTRAQIEDEINNYGKRASWFRYLRRQLQGAASRNEIFYIPSHSVAQRVFFSREDRNDYMSTVIGDYKSCNFKEGGKQEQFVQTWLKNFGIGLNYKIETIQGEAFSVTMTNMQGQDVPLADMGMGSIQIVLLLLKLATLMSDVFLHSPLIIVEEPEQNIHPKLQSRLAELFAYLHKEYHFRFIIETHSEYMIRKTQAMIATGDVKYEDNPFKVYYFPEEGAPYDMVYQQSGMFENKFDEGFFDEASKQQFSVIKKAREIQHV